MLHQKVLKRLRLIEKNKFLPIYDSDIYSGYSTAQGLVDDLILVLPEQVADIEFIIVFGDVSDPGVKAQICNITVVIYSSRFRQLKTKQYFIYPTTPIHKDVTKQSKFTKDRDHLMLDGEIVDVEFISTVIEEMFRFVEGNTVGTKEKVFLVFDPFSAFNKKFDEHVKAHEGFKAIFGIAWKVDLSAVEFSEKRKFPVTPGPSRLKYRTFLNYRMFILYFYLL